MNILTKIYETKIIQNSQKCLKKLKEKNDKISK